MMVEIPDVYQRAIRLSVAVLIACVIGYGLILPDEGIQAQHRKEFSNGLKWSAITCIVVSAPVIGRVAQTGTERIVGTVIGGFLGYGVFSIGSLYWNPFSDGVVLSIAAAIVAFSHVIIGAAFNLENSTKLYALTFMLVTFGSENLASRKGSLVLALTRISGICFGVLLSEITSVLIFPKSAVQEALVHLRNSIKNLVELNAMAWQHGPLFRPEWSSMLPTRVSHGMEEGFPIRAPLNIEETWMQDAEEREKRFEEECERVLMQTYSYLNKVQDYLPQARSEIYVGHCQKSMCFFPGIPWLQIGRRVLPEGELQELATCIRRVARLLWAVHLSFQQGFDVNMLEMLKQQYPARLMPELAQQTQGCLQDMLDAFPNDPCLPRGHLNSLISAVESLLRISDYQRRRILHHMKHMKDSTSSRSRRRSPLGSAQTSPKLIPAPSRAASQALSPKSRLENREYAFGRSKSKRYDVESNVSTSPRPADEPKLENPKRGQAGGADADELRTPLLNGNQEVQEPHRAASMPSSTYQPPQPDATSRRAAEASPFASATALTSQVSYRGSPDEVFRNLPEGLRIEVGSPSEGQPQHSYTVKMGSEEGLRTVNVHLQRVESRDLIVFPETAEGYVDKVRWYSFQFLMEELTEEIEIMHNTVNSLLQKLPSPCLSLK